MDKLNNMLGPPPECNLINVAPKKREPNQFIRRYHVKNKLSLDIDPTFSHAFDPLSLTLQKEPASKIEPVSNKYQTLNVDMLRESLHSSNAYGKTIDDVSYSKIDPDSSFRKDNYPPPPKTRYITPNPRNSRHKNYHSIDYDREHSITIEKHNSSIYSQKPPTPARKASKGISGTLTTIQSKQSRVASLGPISKSKKSSIHEIKESKVSGTLLTSELPSTKESYTTLTSAYQSKDRLLWQDSGLLEKDPKEIIQNIVQKHIEDSYKKISIIKANFKKNNNKFLFQLYSED